MDRRSQRSPCTRSRLPFRRAELLPTLCILIASATACGSDRPREVSLLRVLLEPGALSGERVVLRGFLGSDMALYPSRETARTFDHTSSLSVLEPATAGGVASRCAERNAELRGRVERREGTPRRSRDPRDYQLTEVDRVLALAGDGRHARCWGSGEEEG